MPREGFVDCWRVARAAYGVNLGVRQNNETLFVFGQSHYAIPRTALSHMAAPSCRRTFSSVNRLITMPPNGIYQERLPCGGTLKITVSSWEIEYYFSGPDYRYNGTFVRIPGDSIQDYIDAYRENWAEYQRLKATVPGGGDFSQRVSQGMTIRIGAFNEGICIQSYHMPIRSLDNLNQLLDGYLYATGRAVQVQKALATL